MQLGSPEKITDLPPCWKESDLAAARGVDRLFVHLDGPGFIGVEDGTAELVTADLARGEEPDPETRPATLENVQELAANYNDEFYGDDNHSLEAAGETNGE
ncbi:hypothetical protein FGF80_18625 (plasmid) [Natrinema pallidum]|uniref:Uncharacterized protein n=2 Tax=Natrinema pallidum TaxID=69527 RepID=A0A4P9TJX8_9EURY|nr:hypothetical protein FGF80_18625 [Natrinema pallidum]